MFHFLDQRNIIIQWLFQQRLEISNCEFTHRMFLLNQNFIDIALCSSLCVDFHFIFTINSIEFFKDWFVIELWGNKEMGPNVKHFMEPFIFHSEIVVGYKRISKCVTTSLVLGNFLKEVAFRLVVFLRSLE